MKTITKYQANDGSEWQTAQDATKRDSLHLRVKLAMSPLGITPQAVMDGKGWLQHDPETVLKARDAILDICRQENMHKSFPVLLKKGRDCHPSSVVGRILTDSDGPLSTAWTRFMRIDDKGREHQQPYYAFNGPLPEHVCVETRI